MAFDFLPFIQYGSLVVGIVVGVWTIRGSIKKNREETQRTIINTITEHTDDKLDTISTKIETIKTIQSKDHEIFLTHVSDAEKIIDSIQTDLKIVEKEIQELERLQIKNDIVLGAEVPKLCDLKREFQEFQAKVNTTLELMKTNVNLR